MKPAKFRIYKKLFAVVTFSFISNMCISQYTKDRYHIKDSLSKFNVSSYSIYEMENDGNDSLLIETLFFDKNGNLIKEFEPKYSITILYKYDSLQRLIERHTYCPGIQNETVYSFYSEDKLSKEIRKDSTGFVNETRDFFYKDSRLHTEHVDASYGARDINYKYDSTGLHVTESSPAYSGRTEITRNKYGGIIHFEMIDSLKHVPEPVWFAYNKDLRIEEYHFFNDQKIVTHKMIYDNQGKILEIQSCGDGYYNHPCTTRYKFYYEYFT